MNTNHALSKLDEITRDFFEYLDTTMAIDETPEQVEMRRYELSRETLPEFTPTTDRK